MTNFKKLTIWTIALSFFIIVGLGHGIGCMGLIELAWLTNFNTEDFSISLTSSYNTSLNAVALFAIIGHLLLIISLFVKAQEKNYWIKITGTIFLWISVYYLTHNLFTDSASQIGFFSAIPFLICSGILFYSIVKQRIQGT